MIKNVYIEREYVTEEITAPAGTTSIEIFNKGWDNILVRFNDEIGYKVLWGDKVFKLDALINKVHVTFFKKGVVIITFSG